MKTIVTVALSLLVALESVSAVEPIYAVRLAIDGYDVVAYFNQGEARRGSPEFEHKWQGASGFFRRVRIRALSLPLRSSLSRGMAATAPMP